MHAFEANALARVIIADRIREANHTYLVDQLKRRKQPATAHTAGKAAARHSRLWSVVHLRHSYS